MAKTNDVVVMKEKLARLNERAKSTESELKRLEDKRKKIQNQIDEVQDFVTNKNGKHFLQDNPSVVISQNENSEGNTFESENAKNENA